MPIFDWKRFTILGGVTFGIGLVIKLISQITAVRLICPSPDNAFKIIYYISKLGDSIAYQGILILFAALVGSHLSRKTTSRLNRNGLEFSAQQIRPILIFGAALGISFLFYYRTINEFFFLDDFWLLKLSRVHSWQEVLEFFNPQKTNFRPVGLHLYYYIIQTLFGSEPRIYHIIRIMILALNVTLLTVMLMRLSKSNVLVLASAFLFITRVCHFDSVFWSCVQDPVAAMFILLSLIYYIKPAGITARIISIFFFVLAILSKEVAVVFPALLLAYEYLFEEGFWSDLGRVIKKILPYAVITFIFLGIEWEYTALMHSTKGAYQLSFGSNAANNILNYLKFILNGPFDPLLAFVLIFGAVFYSQMKVKCNEPDLLKWIGWGLSWFIISLLPVMFIQQVAMHYVYIPSMGICFVLGAMFDFVYRQIKANYNRAGLGLAGLFLVLSFYNTLIRFNREYATNVKITKSRAAENYWRDIQNLHPALPPGANLYFIPYRQEASLEYYYDVTAGSALFQLIYPEIHIKSLEPEEVPVPLEPNTYVFGFDLHHIYELTDEFRRRRTDEPTNL